MQPDYASYHFRYFFGGWVLVTENVNCGYKILELHASCNVDYTQSSQWRKGARSSQYVAVIFCTLHLCSNIKFRQTVHTYLQCGVYGLPAPPPPQVANFDKMEFIRKNYVQFQSVQPKSRQNPQKKNMQALAHLSRDKTSKGECHIGNLLLSKSHQFF